MKPHRFCEQCKKEPATVHLSEITDGVLSAERHLCEQCACELKGQLVVLDASLSAGRPHRRVMMTTARAPEHLGTCERCGRRAATIQTTEIVDGVLSAEAKLCERCVEKRHAEVIPIGRLLRPGSDLAAQARDAIIVSAEVKRCFAERAAADIARAAELVAECLRSGGKVLLCGNGGSAAEAQHIAGELVGRFKLERPAFHAVALTTDTSILTAVANDYGFDEIFARQVQGLGAAGDVLMAYSTSGNSANVLKAIEVARGRDMKVVGFTGASGGAMADRCDVCIKAPSDDTPVVQECHTVAGHTICRLVEQLLCRGDEPPDAPESVFV